MAVQYSMVYYQKFNIRIIIINRGKVEIPTLFFMEKIYEFTRTESETCPETTQI